MCANCLLLNRRAHQVLNKIIRVGAGGGIFIFPYTGNVHAFCQIFCETQLVGLVCIKTF